MPAPARTLWAGGCSSPPGQGWTRSSRSRPSIRPRRSPRWSPPGPSSTKVATVESAWTATPTASSTYLIVDNQYQLDEIDLTEMSTAIPAAGRPTAFAKYNRQILFDKPWDRATYGIRMRYFMNLHEVTLTTGSTTRITRIYQNWQDVLKQGLLWKCLRSIDDSRYQAEQQVYERKVEHLIAKEIPYGGAFQGFTL